MSKVGETNVNSNGTPMRIIRYGNSADVDIEFLDEHHYIKEHNTYRNFKRGVVKNPYDKTIFGIGYLGVGDYGTGKNERNLRDTYIKWVAMLQRCYIDMGDMYKSYYNVANVCEEWFNYQNFAEWYESHYYELPDNEKLHLDKDIKYKGNKIYSPYACILVPQSINEVFHRSREKQVDCDLPETIRRTKSGYKVWFRGESLGVYGSVGECLEKYNKAKKQYVKELIENRYDDLMPDDVKETILNWQP